MMSRASNDIYWITKDDFNEIGEVPPDMEELYISKCNDNRKQLYQQLHLAQTTGNEQLITILNSNLQKIENCINDLDDTARRTAINAGLWQSTKLITSY